MPFISYWFWWLIAMVMGTVVEAVLFRAVEKISGHLRPPPYRFS